MLKIISEGGVHMTKETLIILLKQYKENKAKLKLKLREKEKLLRKIEQLKDVTISAVATGINNDIHSKNSITDKVGNSASDNIDKAKEYQGELDILENEIIELNDVIEEIDIRLDALKYKEKQILIAYYIDGCTYEDIGNRIYWQLFKQTRSERHIRRLIERCTEKIISLG